MTPGAPPQLNTPLTEVEIALTNRARTCSAAASAGDLGDVVGGRVVSPVATVDGDVSTVVVLEALTAIVVRPTDTVEEIVEEADFFDVVGDFPEAHTRLPFTVLHLLAAACTSPADWNARRVPRHSATATLLAENFFVTTLQLYAREACQARIFVGQIPWSSIARTAEPMDGSAGCGPSLWAECVAGEQLNCSVGGLRVWRRRHFCS